MTLLTRERSRLFAFVLLLVAAFVVANLMFNLQHLVLGPETVPELGEGLGFGELGTLGLSWDTLRTFFLSLLIVLLSLLVIAILYLKRKGEKGFFPVYELIGALVALIILLLLMIALKNIGGFGLSVTDDRETGFPAYPGDSNLPLPRSSAAPLGLGILGVAFFIVLLGLLMSRWLGRKPEDEPTDDARQRAVDSIMDTIYRLELGENLRTTILGCYADMTKLFKQRGLRYGDYVTARELERLAVDRLGLTSLSAVRLRELFEEARYSSHMLLDEYRDMALQCLNSVRDELEGLRDSVAA